YRERSGSGAAGRRHRHDDRERHRLLGYEHRHEHNRRPARRRPPIAMATTDPPRLVLRFAVCTCVALALAAGAVLMVVRHLVTVQAEHAATTQARVIANSALRGSLLPSDLERPVSASRQAALDELFQSSVL